MALHAGRRVDAVDLVVADPVIGFVDFVALVCLLPRTGATTVARMLS